MIINTLHSFKILIVGETVDRRRSIWEFSVVVVNISMNLKLLQVTKSIDSKEEV